MNINNLPSHDDPIKVLGTCVCVIRNNMYTIQYAHNYYFKYNLDTVVTAVARRPGKTDQKVLDFSSFKVKNILIYLTKLTYKTSLDFFYFFTE